MENDTYTMSNLDSGDFLPWSTEIDFENTPPWEEQPAPPPSSNYEVKFMCSYGGKFHSRPQDKKLSYIDGETKILAVDRNTKFTGLIRKLSVLCHADVCFEYQLPGEDLDALISVTNDDDLEHMMREYCHDPNPPPWVKDITEKLPPATLSAALSPPVSSPQGYRPEKQLTSSGVYTAVPEQQQQQQQQQQQVFMIQTPAGLYHELMGKQPRH
ncbi:uncharacterized protein LOC114266711 [Camellia sinensis]|uniref:uncharacterized protein LOC114266711 n=1 Tax=Camellia sinensis TaxID=4442 RepID=UPI00103560CC|nr:uncharacterized protein LOC114266711 [Camellia sinensis]